MSAIIHKKICMLGEFAVGKTSLVQRFVHERFDDRYLSTIGVKISRKLVSIEGLAEVNFLLWDLAGSEEFSGNRSSYLQGASGAILVCDLTRCDTYFALAEYARQIRAINPTVQIVIAGNKTDLLITSLEDIKEKTGTIATEIDAPIYFTSARTGENVNEIFDHLARELV